MRPFCVSSICLRFNVYCKDDKFTKIPFAGTGENVGEGVVTAFVPFYGSFPRMLASLISRVEKKSLAEYTHTLSLFLFFTNSPTHPHFLSLSLSLTHTHTHTYGLKKTHSPLMRSLYGCHNSLANFSCSFFARELF